MKHCACAFRLFVFFQAFGLIGSLFRCEAASPSIAVTLIDAGRAQLSWANLPSGFRIEEADALSPTNSWRAYLQDPTLQNNQFSVTVVVAQSANRFFRLRQDSITGLPADPGAVAPPLDTTVVSDFSAATAFLYSAENPIQTGVTNGVIDAGRVAVLRGKVAARDGSPLSGVTISVLGHRECGQTLTRADGVFDLAVNGGGQLTVRYEKNGFLGSQRTIVVPWRDYAWLSDVVMIPLDGTVTAVDLSTPAMQVARGSSVSDANGARQATIFFPQGTSASMILANGTTQALSAVHIRATEFTVGAKGPVAMPAPLPPSSGYTYCAELSVDEASAADASQVRFSQAVPFYVENFLGFPVGNAVPTGYYDREKGQWIASANGRVIKVLNINNGLADLDTDGDAAADSSTKLAVLGITTEERAKLAQLYASGQTLWRVLIAHFSAWDCNWPYGPPTNAIAPPGPKLNPPVDRPSEECGSVIGVESQTLGESLAVSGTPWRLHYQSERVPGRKDAYTIEIPVSGPAAIPSSMEQMRVQVSIAGRLYETALAPAPNLNYTLTWDGLDGYGRVLQGAQIATITVHYDYVPQYYAVRSELQNLFARMEAIGTPVTAGPAASSYALSKTWTAGIGAWDARALGLGGWSLSIQHAYDPGSHTLLLGDGQQRHAEALDATGSTITTVAGNGLSGFGGDGGPAILAKLNAPDDVAIGPDDSVYIADWFGHRIRRLGPDGIISTVAGTGSIGFSGDGGPAVAAQLNSPKGVALGPDGSLFIADSLNGRVRRVGPDGIITTVAGDGNNGFKGDGGRATAAQFDEPQGVAVGPDGSLFIVDHYNSRVRRVRPDGIITTVAGNGSTGFSGDGGPAVAAQIYYPKGLALGMDGSLFIADDFNHRIRRVGLDGIITTIAGSGASGFAGGFSGDNGPATAAELNAPKAISVSPNGSVFIADSQNHRIRRVGPDGIITTVAGGSTDGFRGDGGLATAAQLSNPDGIVCGPDGGVYFSDDFNHRIRRLRPGPSTFLTTEIVLPSADGRELYGFNSGGRHLKTLDALTGAVQYQFGYSIEGYLATVTDVSGNVTTIERAGTTPSAIVAPGGQRTTLVTGDTWLLAAKNPSAGAQTMSYSADGLLQSFVDPLGNIHGFTYDSLGRLIRDEDPAGGSTSLERTDQSNGYTVTTTSALGRIRIYQVEEFPTGTIRRTVTQPSGAKTVTETGLDGREETTSADGSTRTIQWGPDPRWGMLAPVASSVILKTPGGRTRTITTTRKASISDPLNLLSLTKLTDTVTDNGELSTRVYDGTSRLLTITTAVGRTASFSLDEKGRLAQEQISGVAPLAYGYDSQGFLTSLLQGTGTGARTNRFHYTAAGYVIGITDPLEHSLTFAYDAAGRVTTQILPDARITAFAYDANGNVTSVMPPGKPAHTFEYSSVGLKTLYSPPPVVPGTNSTPYTYDLDRELTAVNEPGQEVVRYDYSPTGCNCGRLASLIQARGTSTYSYDPGTGNLTAITAPGGIGITFSYDGALLTTETRNGVLAGTINNLYDSTFRLTNQTVNGSPSIAFQYDSDGLLTRIGALTLSRNGGNGLIEKSAVGQINSRWRYNEFGEISNFSSTFNATELYAVQFTRDQAGRIIQKTETIDGVTDQYVYSYDLAGHLASLVKNGAVAATYSYDSNDNRATFSSPGGVSDGSYDNQDRLIQYGATAYEYAESGALKTRKAAGQITSYQYDAIGNLITVTLPDTTHLEYLLDGLNRRIGKKVNGTLVQGFLFDGQLRRIAELDGAGNVISRFVYGTRNVVPDYMIKAGVSYQIISDCLGSPRLVVDVATGAIVQRMDYDEFGRVISDTNPGFQPFGFAGGLYDVGTKLVRFGARDYDAETGRWTAKDPIGFDGEDTNLYGYVLSDPVNFKDGNGLAGVSVGGALWIKSKDTKLLNTTSYTGEVLKTLQPGDEVKWLGPDRSSGLHRVEVKLTNGRKCSGYVHPSSLTPTAPSSQVDHGDGKPLDAHALASSGAATRS